MDVSNELLIYEIDGENSYIVGGTPKLIVKQPWNWKREKVILLIDGKEYLVLANELRRAIDNCINVPLGG